MNLNKLENFYIFLFSIIPLSIIIGPSISLINILFLGTIFLIYASNKKYNNFYSNQTFVILILIYFYLIFNSFIAVDFEKSMPRNFGFIRFILFFLFLNLYIHKYQNIESVLVIWTTIILIVTLDSYIEVVFGKNLLGYGDIYNHIALYQ